MQKMETEDGSTVRPSRGRRRRSHGSRGSSANRSRSPVLDRVALVSRLERPASHHQRSPVSQQSGSRASHRARTLETQRTSSQVSLRRRSPTRRQSGSQASRHEQTPQQQTQQPDRLRRGSHRAVTPTTQRPGSQASRHQHSPPTQRSGSQANRLLRSPTVQRSGSRPSHRRSPTPQRSGNRSNPRVSGNEVDERMRDAAVQLSASPSSLRARSRVSRRIRSPTNQFARRPADERERDSASNRARSRSRLRSLSHRIENADLANTGELREPSSTARSAPPARATIPGTDVSLTDNVILTQLVQALQSIGSNAINDKLSYRNTIPEFDPAHKEQTIDIWLHKVNECALIYNWTERQTIHFALPKLKGHAQKWYEGLTTVMYTWPEWQEKLKLAFPSDDNYGQLLTTMLGKRAKFNDSLEEYFYDKVVLLNRCGIEGKKAVDCIIFGIDDRSVRLGAEAARFSTPDQLLPYLKSARNIVSSNNVDRKRMRPNDNRVDRNSVNKEVKERTIQCFNCSQIGHYKSQCPKPIIKCDKCSRFGHSADKCNENKNSVGSSSNNSSKPVLLVAGTDSSVSKYHKQALVNGVPKTCFIDFGSSATLIKVSEVSSIGTHWETDALLPTLRGFGNSSVQPLGKCNVEIQIDGAKACVDVLVVPDHFLQEPLLVGRSFTEQPHIVIEKDNVFLHIRSVRPKIKLICSQDTEVDGLTLVQFETEPCYTGEIYIDGSSRFQFGKEHYLVQGLFSVVSGSGAALIKGLSSQPFLIGKGTTIARCHQADPTSESVNDCDVLRIDVSESRQAISKDDINSDGGLDDKTTESLVDLLNEYRNCFAFNLQELGKTDVVEMSINLKDDEPVVYRPYRLPVSERTRVRGMVQELLECDIIRPSTSPYASPIVVVKKKTGDVRLCVDYRALNRKTFRENFPLPRIDDQLDDLAGYEYYTTLDLASGYYQIAIRDEDRFKTSFVTPDGQFEFNRMPFGLANAPSNFMRMINLVLGNAKDIASAYMDDIIIPSKTIEEGLQKLRDVLLMLQNAGLTLKLSKCCFFSRTVDYLGFELSSKGIKPGSRKIEAVRDFPEPTNQHGVRQFIGLCSFFRRFVKDFSMIAKPLTCLLKKDAQWIWGTEQVKAFNTLKEELLRKPTLALYDPNALTELHTDACKIGIAGILLQRNKAGVLRPVAYYSRQTTPDEQHMTAYELETLALIASLQRFRVYLVGIDFKVFTDCNSLRATFLKRDLIPRVARWWISMQEFNFTIDYRPGKAMAYVDALSRNPPAGDQQNSSVNKVDEVLIVADDNWLSTVQQVDSEIQRKISILQDPESANVIDTSKNYVVKNGKLYRLTDEGERWVVPKGVRWQILKQCHDDIGHFAFDKTLAKVKETYWFSKMRRFVKKYVACCLECAYTKSGSKRKVPLHPIPKIDSPFATLHIDHVGPFVKSSKGNTHMLVIIDAYTKFIILKPVKSTKTSIVIDKLKEYFSIFGVPKRIISDRGSSFTSTNFKDFLHRLGVKHILNAVATPRANGQVERYNRTLLDSLTAKCAGQDEKKWDQFVNDVQWGLNNTHNKGIGRTPSEALFGTSLTGAVESRLKTSLDQDHTITTDSLQEIRDKINDYITSYQEKQKLRYDRSAVQPKRFQIGDLVSIEREIPSTGQSRKLVPKYQGPYRVTSVFDNDRYQVEDTPITRKGGRSYSSVVAIDKIKPWMSFSRPDEDSASNSTNSDVENIDDE